MSVPTTATNVRESRRAVRSPRVRDIVIYPDARPSTGGYSAQLQDVSTFGLGFVQSRPMTIGTEFVLRLELEDDQTMPLLFRVAYCRPEAANQFRIGAQLLRVINGNESIDINADQGVEFGEAMVDMMVGQPLGMIGRAADVEADDLSWAILVDSEECAELLAISERKEAERSRLTIAA
ncbi:MAG TPA: hypothetical protein VGN72_07275 [Tepidisphaeraceae bacterium]|jgi:Tfp pilus assembly protein PilZ|nr:hypothetical protein [Tepidisphaeraceae bacterium]